MKKIIAIAMALVMMMLVAVPAFAATGTVTGGENAGNDTIINTLTTKEDGSEADWYTVAIPATQEIYWEATTTNIEYTMNSQLATGDYLKVSVADANNEYLMKKEGSTATLAYAITDAVYEATNEVLADVVDTVTIDTSMAAWTTVPVDAYSDTLTFTAEIV